MIRPFDPEAVLTQDQASALSIDVRVDYRFPVTYSKLTDLERAMFRVRRVHELAGTTAPDDDIENLIDPDVKGKRRVRGRTAAGSNRLDLSPHQLALVNQLLSFAQAGKRVQPEVPILAVLDLSTRHLNYITRETLNGYEGVTAYSTAHGWLMYVPTDEDFDALATEGEWPPELLPIVNLARNHDCTYILFDDSAAESRLLDSFPA